jgi:hypothetical protein
VLFASKAYSCTKVFQVVSDALPTRHDWQLLDGLLAFHSLTTSSQVTALGLLLALSSAVISWAVHEPLAAGAEGL